MKFKQIKVYGPSWTINPSTIEREVINNLRKPVKTKTEQDLNIFWETLDKEAIGIRWISRYLIPSNERDKYAGYFDFSVEIFYAIIDEEPSDDIEELIRLSHKKFIDEFRNQKESDYFYEPPQVSQDTIDNYVDSFHVLLEERQS